MSEDTFKISDLCTAVTDGDTERIADILDAQADLVNVCLAENNEHRPLHFAVLNENEHAVRLLVERGAGINNGIYPHRDATGPLTIATERGLGNIVQIIREEEEKLQLAACENITITEENDTLFDAVKEHDDAAATELIDKYPELLNACHRNGGSVLYAAACTGRYHLVGELLKRGADLNHRTPDGASPLDGAVHNVRGRARPINEGCLIAAGLLLQAGCKASLESAVALGDLPLVRQFAKEYTERFKNDGTRRLGLLQAAVLADNLKMVDLLLELGCHPDDRHKLLEYETKPDSWGQPLWNAAGDGQHEIAEMLLEAGADPNASVYASGTPVSRAYNSRDEEMKGLLLRYGGVLEAQFAGLEGETAAASVHLQNDPGLAEKLLWAAGCGGDVNLAGLCLRQLDWKPDDSRWMNILEQPLRLWRLSPHRKFKDVDRTVYPQIFGMILDHGADPSVVGRYGYRLSHRLAACGTTWNQVVMTEQERVAFATILLDHGAKLDVVDELLQSTPLGWAVRWGRYELARLYLERGADPTLSGADWAAPLAWAEKTENHGLTDLIQRYL
jgi:ankyrin repeat protein